MTGEFLSLDSAKKIHDSSIGKIIPKTKEEIINLPEGSKYKVYNPLTCSLKEEISGKNDIAHNKYAYDKLEYYVESEVN